MTNKRIKGNKEIFAIEYEFFNESCETEIALYVEGINILAFKKNEKLLTTRWNIDELALWLRNFIDKMKEDPFPFDCKGYYAAQKDDDARNYDTDDEEMFDCYYQKLYEWNIRHRWRVASSGAILADVFFQMVGNNVEISWDNRSMYNDVTFLSLNGGTIVSKEYFIFCVDSFLKEYAMHWF